MPQEPPPQQGPGTHTFVDGSYTGEFQAGKRHGQGKMIYLADSSYEGAWAKDKKHGYGVLSSASGNGCVRHGRGMPGVARGGAHTQRAAASSAGSMRQDSTDARWGCGGGIVGSYTGDYHYDKMQGNGIQTWSDGRRCVRHGRGMPGVCGGRMLSGRSLERWHVRTGPTKRCGGAADTGAGGGLWVVDVWVGLCVGGLGVVDRYEGVFKNNEKGGRGVYTFSNGCRYVRTGAACLLCLGSARMLSGQ
jgi:hypothetical protein